MMQLVVVAIFLLTIPFAEAQTATASQTPAQMATKDAAAVQLLNQAVSALGGAQAIGQIQDSLATGQVTAFAGGLSGPVKLEDAGGEFRYEFPGKTAPQIFVSGHGHPAVSTDGVIQKLNAHVTMTNVPPLFFAPVLMAGLSNSNVEIDPSVAAVDNGNGYLKIVLTDQSDDLAAKVSCQEWYVDPQTLLPARIDYFATENRDMLNIKRVTFRLTGYHAVSGALVPFQIQQSFDGQVIRDISLNSVQFNNGLPQTDFDLAGGR